MSWGVAGISVGEDGQTWLEDVDLEIDRGAIVAVVGGDGAGKTTLARALVGLVGVTRGEVRVPPRHRIGYQPASSGVWPDLTVRENLGFVADAYRLPKAVRRRRIGEVLMATGLETAQDRLGAQLSGGMRQKLGVGMAILSEPDLVVLDEPTTGVDPVSRRDLWRLITETSTLGTSVVFTTTYLDEAERAPRIMALDGGRVLVSGTLDQVLAAVPGPIVEVGHPTTNSWRRGRALHAWYPSREQPQEAVPIDPDLTDVLIAVSLQRGSS